MRAHGDQKTYRNLYSQLGQQGRGFPTKTAFVERLRQLGQEIGASTAIEFGCGMGCESTLLQKLTGWSVTATDASQEMLNNLSASVRGQVVDVRDPTAFSRQECDLAFCSFLVHLLSEEEKLQFYKYVYGTLASMGIFVILTASKTDLRRRRVSYYFPSALALDMHRYLSVRKNEALLRQAGFSYTSYEQISMPEMHTEDELLMFEDKVCSIVRLLSDEEYRAGMVRLKKDIQNKHYEFSRAHPTGRKWYRTLIIAQKPHQPFKDWK